MHMMRLGQMSRSKFGLFLLPLLGIILASCSSVENLPGAQIEVTPQTHSPVPIIFDTDYGYDVDDVGALALLNALADNGEAKILATIAVVNDQYTPGAMDAVNTYYGRPGVPLGQNPFSQWTEAYPYWRNPSPRFVWNLDTKFPNDTSSSTPMMSAVGRYRKTLAAQPDGSVTIVAVGFLENLSDLMKSGADSYSSLSGMDLIRRKVDKLVVMGGSYPSSDRDFNLGGCCGTSSVSASQNVAKSWPTDIVWTPGDVCGDVYTGQTLASKTPSSNPVREAYKLFFGQEGRGRDSWDLCSVLYAVRGLSGPFQTYFTTSTSRHLVVNNDGSNEWVLPGNSRHIRLIRTMSTSNIEDVMNDLITQAPKN